MDQIARFFSMLLLGAFLLNMIVNLITGTSLEPGLSSAGLQNHERQASQMLRIEEN